MGARFPVVAVLSFCMSSLATAQTATLGPGTSPSPGPTNPTIQNQATLPPRIQGSGSRGMTGNDDAVKPGNNQPNARRTVGATVPQMIE